MEKGREFSFTKINKYIDKKRKTTESKNNYLNLTQLNGSIYSPTYDKNPIRILSQEKERSETNENLKLKLEKEFNKNGKKYFDLNLNKENNSLTSKGKIINYIMKNDKREKINTNIKTNNSTVLKSKSAKKLIESITIRKNNNNSSIFKTNNQNFSSNNMINNNTNNNIINKNNIINTNNNFINTNNLSIEKFLAKEILKFLEEMKNLQISICKKEPNIKELKKNFEKRKSNLYQEALKFSKTDSNIQIIQDNRSYSSLISSNSAITTGTPLTNSNIINYSNQNVKELTDSISVLRTALEDIKSNSQFITSQLRSEITNLNNKVSKQMNSIVQYEKNINNNLNSIRNIYKLLKPYYNGFNLNSVMDSLQSQNSFSYNVNQQENKFEWYENEIKKIINSLDKNNNNNIQNITNNENNNIHIIDQKSSITDINDPNKLYFNIKNLCSEIIEMIRPYINEDENENELNSIFDTKDNFEDGVIMNEIENLKKIIKSLLNQIDNLNIDKIKLEKELNESRIQCETYKNALNNTVINKMKYNKKTSFDDDDNFSESENFRKLNNDLLAIQNDLLQKLEMKDIENERNQEEIRELLELNKKIDKEDEINQNNNNDLTSNYVSVEKYRYLLNLFDNEQDRLKQLKSDYLHLIQDLSNYIENGTKISIDLNKLNLYTNKKTTYEFNLDEELDSKDLGKLNDNDLLTDKSTLSNKNLQINIINNNNKEIQGNILNKYNNNNSNNNNNNKVSNFKQINNYKIELKQYKNEIEKLNKKLNDVNDIITTLSSAIIKLFFEVQYSNKGKELFNLIFKLLNYSEDKIYKLFSEKEKIKK